jgi:hypothetical protein
MAKPAFTADENRLIQRCLHTRSSDWWGWIIVFLPMPAFAGYGIAHRDGVAVFIAWAGTSAWLVWWIVRGARNGALLRGILEKYAQCTAENASNDAGSGSL